MLRNLSENLGAKFPATTISYSMVKSARGKDAFSEIFELEASPINAAKGLEKEKKGKAKKN